MITVELTKFETIENGKITDTRYGFIIKEPSMDYVETIDHYYSQTELNMKVNVDTIRYILEAEHYIVYREIERRGCFKFDGKILYV